MLQNFPTKKSVSIVFGLATVIVLIIFIIMLSGPGRIGSSPNAGSAIADSVQAQPNNAPSYNGYVWRVTWVTVILLLLVYLGARWYKKFSEKTAPGTVGRIKVISRQYIGPKQSLLIVHVDGKKLVIGMTEHSINLIKDLGEAEEEGEGEPAPPLNASTFSSILKRLRGEDNV